VNQRRLSEAETLLSDALDRIGRAHDLLKNEPGCTVADMQVNSARRTISLCLINVRERLRRWRD